MYIYIVCIDPPGPGPPPYPIHPPPRPRWLGRGGCLLRAMLLAHDRCPRHYLGSAVVQ